MIKTRKKTRAPHFACPLVVVYSNTLNSPLRGDGNNSVAVKYVEVDYFGFFLYRRIVGVPRSV